MMEIEDEDEDEESPQKKRAENVDDQYEYKLIGVNVHSGHA